MQIVYNMQNIFNLLPNLNVDELVRSMLVKTNDMHLVIYVSALIRSVVALHDLVNNKVGWSCVDLSVDGWIYPLISVPFVPSFRDGNFYWSALVETGVIHLLA